MPRSRPIRATLGVLEIERRAAGLAMLRGEGLILETARRISKLLKDAEVEAAIIEGVAVYLHGYVRTTADVDILVLSGRDRIRDALESQGVVFHPESSEFRDGAIPIHLVFSGQAGPLLSDVTEIDGVRTVALSDLISMKLRSGMANLLRAQDLGDVIGLIRARGLTGRFAARLDPEVRGEFVWAIEGRAETGVRSEGSPKSVEL